MKEKQKTSVFKHWTGAKNLKEGKDDENFNFQLKINFVLYNVAFLI